jgi:hypothetical protein
MAQPTPPLYALDPALPVLLRPDGAVQVGWSPRRAVLVRPPRGLTSAGLATLLRTMYSPIPMSELERQADRHGGVAAGELGGLVAQLVAAGVATRGHRPRPVRSASIRVHGRGPLSELLVESLRCSGARVKQSSQPHAAVTSAEADLVVCPTTWSPTRGCYATCTARASRTSRSGCAMASAWSVRWSSPASPAAWAIPKGKYPGGTITGAPASGGISSTLRPWRKRRTPSAAI